MILCFLFQRIMRHWRWLRAMPRLVMRRDSKVNFQSRRRLCMSTFMHFCKDDGIIRVSCNRKLYDDVDYFRLVDVENWLWHFFSLVVKFIDNCWDLEHVTVGLFDAYDISVVGSCWNSETFARWISVDQKLFVWVKMIILISLHLNALCSSDSYVMS